VDLPGLNALAAEDAEVLLYECCASTRWVNRMERSRPFPELQTLRQTAEAIWWSLDKEDWLEAFAGHPRVGDGLVEKTARWPRLEQEMVATAAAAVLADLAECNRAYEERFGHVFLVFASSKTADEILSLCRERIGNDAATEIRIAAEEQARITDLRLSRLLGIG
jgi:OHCU decarboxylase